MKHLTEKEKLFHLEFAIKQHGGGICDGIPSTEIGRALEVEGLAANVDGDKLNPIFFRVTDRGREYVDARVPPVGEW